MYIVQTIKDPNYKIGFIQQTIEKNEFHESDRFRRELKRLDKNVQIEYYNIKRDLENGIYSRGHWFENIRGFDKTNCYIVIDSIYICSIVSSYELLEPGWWNKMIFENNISGKPIDQALPIFVKGFDSFTVTACFNLLFIAIENSFRAFHKAVCLFN